MERSIKTFKRSLIQSTYTSYFSSDIELSIPIMIATGIVLSLSLVAHSLGAVLLDLDHNQDITILTPKPARYGHTKRQTHLEDLIQSLQATPQEDFIPGDLKNLEKITSFKREVVASDINIPGAKRMTLWYKGPEFPKQLVRI
jgi:hypothetical protein